MTLLRSHKCLHFWPRTKMKSISLKEIMKPPARRRPGATEEGTMLVSRKPLEMHHCCPMIKCRLHTKVKCHAFLIRERSQQYMPQLHQVCGFRANGRRSGQEDSWHEFMRFPNWGILELTQWGPSVWIKGDGRQENLYHSTFHIAC